MKIIAIVYLIDKECLMVCKTSDIPFLRRRATVELMQEFATYARDHTDDARKVFAHRSFQFVIHKRMNDCFVFVTDSEYPTKVIYRLTPMLFNNPTREHIQSVYDQAQNPNDVDQIYSIQQTLDETMVIMHENIDRILERGEQIDDLVERSKSLSESSKMFYKASRRMNRCCHLL